MFKLKKILNKHNNAPEYEKLLVSSDTICKPENIYNLQEGSLTSYVDQSNNVRNYYVAYGTVGEFDAEREVVCTRITPDMLFEVKVTSVPTVAAKFILTALEDKLGFSGISLVGSNDQSDGYVVDTSYYATNGTVIVRFHCTQ